MAWLGADGFDTYANTTEMAANTDQWQAVSQCWLPVTQPSLSRFGASSGSCVLILGNLSASAGSAESATFANSSTIYVNFNAFNNGIVAFSTTLGFRLRDGTLDQMGFYLKWDRTFVVLAGDIGTTQIAASGVVAPPAGSWMHLQVKVVIHETAGSVEVRINGSTTPAWSVTGINTRNGSGNSYCNRVMFRSNVADGAYIDDAIWFNDQDDAPNDWIGDVRAVILVPTSDFSIQWTRLSGSVNAQMVDEKVVQNVGSHDGDTTYVWSATTGQIDLYGMENFSTTPDDIVGLQAKMSYRMDEAGPHTVKMRLRSGATDDDSADKTCLNTYSWTQKAYPVDPNDGHPWTVAGVSDLMLGPVNVL